jgi:hypothetical protein
VLGEDGEMVRGERGDGFGENLLKGEEEARANGRAVSARSERMLIVVWLKGCDALRFAAALFSVSSQESSSKS